MLLATAATTGVLLSAVQIVPSVAATKTSQRVTSREGTTTLERVFGIPSQDTHEAQRYGFSIAPWRLLECVWPNVSGHLFPINRRWMFAERREDRIWSPTLYLGLLPFVCALMAWRIRSKTAELSWLSLFAVGAILASFGRNGLGCLARELQMWWTGRPPTLAIGEPVGGLYWLMVQLLPGYGYFRYPAKLFTVASLAISLLAAVGLLQVLTGDRRRVCRLLLVLFCVSVIGGMTLLTTGPRWSEWLTNARGDELFGPLDVEGARATCLTACIHTALLALLLWWLLARSAWPPTGVAVSLLLVTAVELAVSNGSHVLTASKQVMDAHSVFDYIDTPAVHTPTSLTRIYRHPQRTWVPSSWTTTSDSQRGEQVAEWDRATLFPKHHLSRSLGSVQSYNTLYSREYRAMLRADGGDFPPPEILSLLGVEYLVLPEKIEWPIGEPLDPESRLPENVRIWKNADVMPRAWIVHQFEPWGRRRSSDPAVLQKQWRKLLYGPGSDRRSLRTAAVVDSNQWMSQQTRGKAEGETCHVLLERTNRFELDVVLGQPGLVVVSNQFDDGWSVERITNDIRSAEEILCTNGVMLGVRLPAGRHRLVFRYAPLGYLPSVVVTLTCWLGCLGYGLRQVMMHWRQHNGTPIIAGIV